MKRGDGHLLGDTAGRLQLEFGWLSVVESVDSEINTVAIANNVTSGVQTKKFSARSARNIVLYPHSQNVLAPLFIATVRHS